MKPTTVLTLALIALSFTFNVLSAQTAVHTQSLQVDGLSPDEPTKEIYEKETIYLNGNMSEYTKNRTERRVGFFGRKLKKEFETCSQEARNEMALCVKKKKRGALLLSAGGVLLVGALIAVPIVSGPIVAGMAIGGLIPYTLGTVDLQNGQDHMQKSVWLYNRDAISR